MAKFLFSMIVSNDLGPVSRLLPIADILRNHGHSVAFCNRAAAPKKIIEQAGFTNFPVQPSLTPRIFPDAFTPKIWNGNQGMAYEGFLDLDYVRALVEDYRQVINQYDPDIVVDTWNQAACVASKAAGKPLVTIIQADLHPDGGGLIWWEDPPDNLPDPIPVINQVLEELNLPLLKKKVEELFIGDLVLVVGTPETDPLPPDSMVTYIGPLNLPGKDGDLPDWIDRLPDDQPLIWVYSGNPRYGPNPSIADSIIVIRASVRSLADEQVQVVLTTGHQPLPEEFSGNLPLNFHFTDYVPGFAMAKRADLIIHHGGHGTSLTGLSAGTPAIVIPTYSERESNARRIALLGAGEFVLPTEGANNEKQISFASFKEKVFKVLNNPSYAQASGRVAENMAQYGGPVQAAKLIEEICVEISRLKE